MKKIHINGIITNWSVDEDGNVYKMNGSIVPPIDRTKAYPVYRIQGKNIPVLSRLDRIMYETFLGGRYDDGIPVFHIDGDQWNCRLDNLHVGFMEDKNYPGEIWERYHLKDLPNSINKDIVTDYWISTYGRCYSNNYYSFIKRQEYGYPVRIGTDETFCRHAELMVAETFIPNPYKIPYAVQKVKGDDYSVSNIGWSYDEFEYKGIDEVDIDIKYLFYLLFDIEKSFIWKKMTINGVETPYFISMFGKIYNPKTRHIMDYHVDNRGYYIVKLSNKGTEYDGKNLSVHRLVAENFIPNEKNFPFVNHKDANKLNNFVENLEWCTPQQNSHHAILMGRYNPKYGDDHHGSKYKKEVVENVIIEYLRGKEPIELEKIYGIPKKDINYIVRGRRYKKLGDKYNLDSHYTRRMEFVEKYKPLIANVIDSGVTSTKAIAETLGIDYMQNRGFINSFKIRYLNNKDKSSPE